MSGTGDVANNPSAENSKRRSGGAVGSGAGFLLRALRYRNYRLFFSGQLVSVTGSWMTNTATAWLVYRLTGSASMLGWVAFAGQFPSFLLAPVAGVYLDRWNRHRLLMVTQTLSMLQSFVLGYLALSGKITIPWLMTLYVFQAIVNAFDMPCRQTLVVSLIDNKEDLGNAIALNSSLFNLARLLGPSLAGVIIAVSSEGWCFIVDGISYLGVLVALSQMRLPTAGAALHSRESPSRLLREGWRYAIGSRPIRSIILLMGLISLVGFPYTVLLPVFAKTILGGGPNTLGGLMAASGAGALLGALWLASRRSVLGLGTVMGRATIASGVGVILFGLSKSLWLSELLLVFTGFAFMAQMAASNTILQTVVEDEKRGRIMSLYMMAFLGTVPFGGLLAGKLADTVGAPWTLVLGGSLSMAAGLWFMSTLSALRESIRPLYVKMGILPSLPPT